MKAKAAMTKAWKIYKQAGVRTMAAWSEALRSAWKIVKGGAEKMYKLIEVGNSVSEKQQPYIIDMACKQLGLKENWNWAVIVLTYQPKSKKETSTLISVLRSGGVLSAVKWIYEVDQDHVEKVMGDVQRKYGEEADLIYGAARSRTSSFEPKEQAKAILDALNAQEVLN